MGLFDLFAKKESVYFPGCIDYFRYQKGFELYLKIFSKLGINVKVLEEKRCSGLEPWESGYDFEMRKIVRKNFDIFKENNVKSIITTNPGCYKMFFKDYPNILPYWNIEIINCWDLILEKLNKKPNVIIKSEELVTYHDPCYLGRYCNIYETPREIIRMLGYTIREMDNYKEESFCCGSCGGLPRVNKDLANNIARERVLQAKRIGVKKIIVIGFDNYDLLKKNAKDSGIEILELSSILAHALDIKRIEEDLEESILIETKANIRLQNELKEEDYYDGEIKDE
jgi:Fe-S oxidoreductase